MMRKLLWSPLAVDEEYAARLYIAHDGEVLCDVRRVVAGNKVCLIDIVWALNRLVTKTQMRNGYTAGLFGVILEICLNILVCMVADDFDGVLVCTNRTIAAKTPELTFRSAFCCGVRGRLLLQREIGHVIGDAQRKHVLRLVLLQLVINSEYRRWRGILRAQTITAACNHNVVLACVAQCGYHVEIERLALCARLLGAVEDCNLLCTLRNCCNKLICCKRTIQTNLYQTNLLAMCGQVVDDLLCHIADGAHCNDDTLSVRCAIVVEELIIGAKLCIDLAHVLLYDGRNCIIVLVAGLTVLEEDVAILMRAAHNRMLRIEGALTECFHSLHVAHLSQIVVIPYLNLLNLVGSAEAVKEVDERHTGLQCCKVCNSRQIHDFLWVGLAEHCEADLAASHNVRVVTEMLSA